MEEQKIETQETQEQKEEQPKKIRLIKVGGGSLRLGDKYRNKIVKPNETFEVESIEDIPVLFRKFVKPVNPLDIQEKADIVLPDSTIYELKPKGKGWYDVVEKQSQKAINERALRKEDAEKLLEQLT